jgi:hypothetical protein
MRREENEDKRVEGMREGEGGWVESVRQERAKAMERGRISDEDVGT